MEGRDKRSESVATSCYSPTPQHNGNGQEEYYKHNKNGLENNENITNTIKMGGNQLKYYKKKQFFQSKIGLSFVLYRVFFSLGLPLKS